ncbi:MAG: autotransporter outer membrane beta-barrel domain-containing protein [Planctomycetia bacterium]|nr:autotransporter outer membrane beta-barrel domain-containing protein [Planctomycetia bacterium]
MVRLPFKLTGILLILFSLPFFGEGRGSAQTVRGNRGDLSKLPIEPFQSRITGSAFGQWSSLDGAQREGSQSGFDTSVFGGSLGQDLRLAQQALWGYSFHGTSIQLKPKDSRYDGSVSSFAGDLHMSVHDTLWHLDFLIGYGRNNNRNSFAENSLFQENRFNLSQWNYEADAGIKLERGFLCIEPFLGIHFSTLNGSDGNVSSASALKNAGLARSEGSGTSARMILGSKFSWEYNTYLGRIIPEMKGAWIREFCDHDLFTTEEFSGFPVLWRFAENQWSADRLLLNAGISLALRDSMDLYFQYNTMITSRYYSTTIYGGFNKKF